MGENVLIHWGKQGQKWGTRNYRNYDGTLTEEGRKRYDYYENKTDRVYNTARMKQLGPKSYVKTGKWGVLAEDLSKYSNEELKALTTRANLERDYRNAFSTTQYTNGKKLIETFKNTAYEVSAIAEAGRKLVNSVNGFTKALKGQDNKDKKKKNKNKNYDHQKDDDDDDDD